MENKRRRCLFLAFYQLGKPNGLPSPRRVTVSGARSATGNDFIFCSRQATCSNDNKIKKKRFVFNIEGSNGVGDGSRPSVPPRTTTRSLVNVPLIYIFALWLEKTVNFRATDTRYNTASCACIHLFADVNGFNGLFSFSINSIQTQTHTHTYTHIHTCWVRTAGRSVSTK